LLDRLSRDAGSQAFGILKHLSIGRAAARRFIFRGFTALIL
jgi:hypothetical protein